MELWLTKCLQVAAVRRFEAVNATCERNVRGLPGVLLCHVLLMYASVCTASHWLQAALPLQLFWNVHVMVNCNGLYPYGITNNSLSCIAMLCLGLVL
jgi:hypothetical protein